MLLDDDELIDLTLGSTGATTDGSPPTLYQSEEGVGYAYHDVSGAQILVGLIVLE